MSNETLAQNEIDALLDSRTGTAAGNGSSAIDATAEAQNYDFRRPRRVSKDKLRSLQATYDRFAKALEGWLLSRVRMLQAEDELGESESEDAETA